MARADAATLAKLGPLLAGLRTIDGLTEIKPGIFYWKRMPMLHFHDTANGIVADLKSVATPAGGFDRYPVGAAGERRVLLAEAATRCAVLAQTPASRDSQRGRQGARR